MAIDGQQQPGGASTLQHSAEEPSRYVKERTADTSTSLEAPAVQRSNIAQPTQGAGTAAGGPPPATHTPPFVPPAPADQGPEPRLLRACGAGPGHAHQRAGGAQIHAARATGGAGSGCGGVPASPYTYARYALGSGLARTFNCPRCFLANTVCAAHQQVHGAGDHQPHEAAAPARHCTARGALCCAACCSKCGIQPQPAVEARI